MRLLVALILAFAFSSQALATSGPQGFNVRGVVRNAKGEPLEKSVNIKLQVYDKDASCLLYEESHVGVDLADSDGAFSIALGSGGSRSNKVDGSSALKANVFRNDLILPTSSTCSGGLTAASGDARMLRIIVDQGAGEVTMTPDLVIQSSPYANVAESLQGKMPADFLQLGSGSLSQANVETVFSTTNFPKLGTLLAGTSTDYIRSTTTGATMPSFGTDPVAAPAGAIWYDSANNQLKYQSNLGPQVLGTSSGGVTGVIAGSGLSGGTITGSGTISLTATGVAAGTYTRMIVDTYGRVTSGTILSASDIPSLDASAIASGTISAARLPSTVSPWTVSGADVYRASGSVGIGTSAPTAGAVLDVTGTGTTLSSLLVPRDSTANRPTGVAGMLRFNTSNSAMEYYDGTSWVRWVDSATGLFSTSVVASYSSTGAYVPVDNAAGLPGSAASYGVAADNFANSDNSSANVKLSVNNSATRSQSALIAAVATSGTSYSPSIVFGQKVGSTNYLERMRIDPNGNVGVGTTTPATMLDVKGSIKLGTGTCAAATQGSLQFTANTIQYCNTSNVWTTLSAVGTSQWNNGASSSINYSAGNVGIGTTSPGTPLQIVKAQAGATLVDVANSNPLGIAGFTATSDANQMTMQILGSGAGSQGQIVTEASLLALNTNNASGRIGLFVNGTSALHIDPSRKVGIGTTAPSQKMEVVDTKPALLLRDTGPGDGASGGDLIFHQAKGGVTFNNERLGGVTFSGTDTGGAREAAAEIAAYSTAGWGANGLAKADILFGTSNADGFGVTEKMRLTAGGAVGIGTFTPQATLDVNGGVRVGTEPTCTSSTNAGTIRFSGGLLQYCAAAGNTWTTLGAGGSGDVVRGGNTQTSGTMVIGTNDAYPLAFEVGNTTRMIFDASGQIAIGTTNPVPGWLAPGSLWVEGQVLGKLGLGMASDLPLFWSDSSAKIFARATSQPTDFMFFQVNGTNRLHIDGAGNVGIGTSTPQYQLHVAGSGFMHGRIESNNDSTELDLYSYGVGKQSMIFLSNSRGTKAAPSYLLAGDNIGYVGASPNVANEQAARIMFNATSNWSSGNTPGEIVLATTPSGTAVPVNRMWITPTGTVGIGTNSPQAQLEVVGGIRVGDMTTCTSASNAGTIRFSGGNLQFCAAAGNTWTTLGGGGSGDVVRGGNTQASGTMIIGTNDAFPLAFETNNTNRLLIDTNGNVGIGTTAPGMVLDIQRSQNAETSLYVSNNNGGTAAEATIAVANEYGNGYMSLASDNFADPVFANRLAIGTGQYGLNLMAHNATGTIAMYTGGYLASNERVRIDSSGKVGIGTTAPVALLNVKAPATGTTDLMRIQGNAANGSGYFAVDAYGNTYATSSYASSVMVGWDNNVSAGAVTTHNASDLYLTTNAVGAGTNNIILKPKGNVGIGTTSPRGRLSFPNTVSLTPGLTENNIIFWESGADTYGIGVSAYTIDIAANAPGGQIAFYTGSSTPQERAKITNLGYFGIGTGSPGSKLSVNGGVSIGTYSDVAAPANSMIVSGSVGVGASSPATKLDVNGSIKIGTGTCSASTQGSLQFSGGNIQFCNTSNVWTTLAAGGTGDVVRGGNTQSSGTMVVGTNDAFPLAFETNNTTRIAIDPSGNVAIGSDTPATNFALTLERGATGYAGIHMINSTAGAGLDIGLDPNSANAFIWNANNGHIEFGTYGLSRMRITATGNVGVGTTAPETALDINGPITMRQGYFEKVGALGTLTCGASNISGFTTNIYALTACSSGTTTLNIPTVSGWPSGNMSWNVTFFVTGQTSSVFNVTYNGATTEVYWDKNSTGGSGGANYSGFAVTSGSTSVISCLVLNTGTVKVYCGVGAQY